MLQGMDTLLLECTLVLVNFCYRTVLPLLLTLRGLVISDSFTVSLFVFLRHMQNPSELVK